MEIVNLTVHRYTNLKFNAFLDTLDQEKNHTMIPQLKHFWGVFSCSKFTSTFREVLGMFNKQCAQNYSPDDFLAKDEMLYPSRGIIGF